MRRQFADSCATFWNSAVRNWTSSAGPRLRTVRERPKVAALTWNVLRKPSSVSLHHRSTAKTSTCSASPRTECCCSYRSRSPPRNSSPSPRHTPTRQRRRRRKLSTMVPTGRDQRPARIDTAAKYSGCLISLLTFLCNLSLNFKNNFLRCRQETAFYTQSLRFHKSHQLTQAFY